MFSKSKRFGDNIHGGKGRRHTTLSVSSTIPGPSSQSRGQESHRFCPCFWGRSHPWFFARSQSSKNLPRSNHKIFCGSTLGGSFPRPTTAMTAETSLPAMVLLANGATGMVFSGTLKVQGNPCALKRILETEFNKKMVIQFVHLKKLSHHLLIENCLQDAL